MRAAIRSTAGTWPRRPTRSYLLLVMIITTKASMWLRTTKDVYTGAVGGDRRNGLGLHGADRKLIEAAGPANKNSIVVLIGGNMIMLEGWKDSVASILMGYYPGMEGGTALGEIIYGDVNPSGKLPFVIPNREDQLPSVDWNGTTQYYDYYHGYRKLDKEEIRPAVPYGFGLS
ncbi:MAG: glycoside hydrolase family 3 protein [Enterocloster clostridioformis]